MKFLVQLLLIASVAGLKGPQPLNLKLKRTRTSQAFKSLPKNPDFQEAKNVCLQITDACSGKISQMADDDSNKLMSKLHLQPMPAGFDGKVVQSALLITRGKDKTIDKHHTSFQLNEQELSESILPMFDFIHDLHQKVTGQLFSAVVMPQVPSANKFENHESFDADVLDSLLETGGSKENAEKMFCEDIKTHEKVCFNRLLHYRHGHDSKSAHTPRVSKVAAAALREEIKGVSAKAQSTGRQAVLVLRKDHMGWVNFMEVEQKVRKALSDKCWHLKTVEPSDTTVEHAIESMQDADLVLANHGAHNEHMIWMPRGAAFIEDKNCKCSAYGYEQLAAQEGIAYATTAGSQDDAQQCALQHEGFGICAKDKPRVVNFEVEILPTLENTIQLLEKSRSTPSDCNKVWD